MKRFGQVIGVKPEHLDEYVKAHAAVWPAVLEQIRRSNIRYLRPVRDEAIVARGLPLEATGEEFFYELLRSKGHSKIDVATEIVDAEGTLVSFQGSYVVQKK